MAMSSLQDLFIHHLKDIYYAEKKLAKALPKMASKATEPALRSAFEEHKLQTEEHVKRLEQVFELAGKKASGTTCPAIDGIRRSGSSSVDGAGGSRLRHRQTHRRQP